MILLRRPLLDYPFIYTVIFIPEMIAYIDEYFPSTYISYSVNNALHASADKLTERLDEVKVQYISKKYGLLDNNLTDDFVFQKHNIAINILTNLF